MLNFGASKPRVRGGPGPPGPPPHSAPEGKILKEVKISWNQPIADAIFFGQRELILGTHFFINRSHMDLPVTI